MKVRIDINGTDSSMFDSPEAAYAGLTQLLKDTGVSAAQALFLITTGHIKIKRMSK